MFCHVVCPLGYDGGSRFFQNVGACLPQCMAGHLDSLHDVHDEQITPWSRLLHEKALSSQILKKYYAIYRVGSFICAWELAADPHPEPHESSLYPHILFLMHSACLYSNCKGEFCWKAVKTHTHTHVSLSADSLNTGKNYEWLHIMLMLLQLVRLA